MPSPKKTEDPRIETARTNVRLAIALRNRKTSAISVEAGMSTNALGTFVNGKSSISYANLLRVCDCLGIPIGLLHIPGAINENRLRLHSILERVPEDQAGRVARVFEEFEPK